MATIQLTPQNYLTAADAFRGVSHAASRYLASAELALSATGGMAGDDASGQSFSAGYDSMAASVLQSMYDLAAAAAAIDRGLTSTASVHAQVEGMLCGRGIVSPFALRPSLPEVCVAPPPVSWGGDRSRTPESWSLIEQFVAVSWPNADPDALRAAGLAWGNVADDLTALARLSRVADAALLGELSGERAQIDTTLESFALNIDSLASYARLLSAECDGYAAQVDSMRAETGLVIAQLVIEVALSVGIGAALSVVTFGVGAVVGGSIATARLVAIGARITAIIQRLGTTAVAAAARITQVSSRLFAVAAQHPQFLRLGNEVAVGAFSSMAAEGMFRGDDTNYLAAGLTGLGGGLLGGSVGLKIASMLGGRSLNLLSQSGIRLGADMASGAGDGALGAAIDGLVRDGRVDLGQVALGAGLGTVIGGAFSFAGGSPGRELPSLGSASDAGGSGGVDLPSARTPDDMPELVPVGGPPSETVQHVGGDAASPSRTDSGDATPGSSSATPDAPAAHAHDNTPAGGHDSSDVPPGESDPAVPHPHPDDHVSDSDNSGAGSPVDSDGAPQVGDPVYAAQQGWPFDLREPALVHFYSTHNPDSNTVMLGSFKGVDDPESYQNQAEAKGYTYFSTEWWDEIMEAQRLPGNDAMFDVYNLRFLEAQAAQGKTFVFTHDPEGPEAGNSLIGELKWLMDNGYTYDAITMTARPASG